MTEPFESTFVLFVDMLGFADLVEQEGDQLNELSAVFSSIELYDPLQSASLLGYRFMNFHQCVNRARERLQTLGNGTGVVFSDSAFFRIDDLTKAIAFARELMFDLVTSEVPVRMGLAHGSYRMLRFATDSSDQVLFHMSQFLGTGIVRAHKTEACGLPGLRILLHPNLEDALDMESLRLVTVTRVENMSLDVRAEVNYLDPKPDESGPDFDDCIQFDCLRNMAADTSKSFQHHYEETYAAWNIMRRQLGRRPYPWEKFLDREAYDDAHGVQFR